MNKIIFFNQVYDVVKKIPKGKVMSYGQIGAILGSPYYARKVGQAMSLIPSSLDIPWQRVIKSSGHLPETSFKLLQKQLLLNEGVIFVSESKVNISCFFNAL
ncbi:MAG: MGMT family protein [Clostridiales bacterium]|nr:MGMT family protein [Clostridiales bacterium]